MRELVVARNPDPDSSLRFLVLVPVGDGLVFRTSSTWPREKALFCYPVDRADWPDEPDVVERIAVRTCERRGAAIELVVDRAREHRSQIVYTTGRGRQMVFWQSPRTRKQSKPRVSMPTARASGQADLHVVVDSHERYPYTFAGQQVTTERGPLRCGDYGLVVDDTLVASVERKSVADLTTSLTDGRLRFALGELAALPRAAVVVEERYSALLKQEFVLASVAADAVAEMQVRYPNVPIVFRDNRKLSEEWTFRFLGAAAAWWRPEQDVVRDLGSV